MSTSTDSLPRTWDLTSFFPTFDGPEYRAFTLALRTEIAAALARATKLAALPATAVDASAQPALAEWAAVFAGFEDLAARGAHLGSYLSCLGAANAADEAVQAEDAALSQIRAELGKVSTQLLRAIRPAGQEVLVKLLAEPALRGAAHTVTRQHAEAVFQMPAEHEALAADLGVDGFEAWSRLYDTLGGKMTFELVHPDGRRETVPMAQRRALMAQPDRALRAAAFADGNKAWAAQADTCAAALNGLAGTRHTLYARRGRGHFLDAPLHDAAVSRETIDAMFAAIAENYELPRRILRLGARIQRTPALAWYDLEAPRPLAPVPTYTWEEGVAAVQSAFDAAYPKFGEYFRGIIRDRWVESEKRPNKRGGAFLTGSPVTREERIYMTFSGTVGDVVTLAHEAGHAWHTHVLGGLRPCARDYPMTLAETASTFAEKILVHGLLSAPGLSAERRAFLVDMETNHTPSYLLNIPVRYIFERRFYEERKNGIVSPTRLCELMTAAQREVYGDALEAGGEDPWFWASKMHFFISGVSFYNFPYTFGFLLSQALFAELLREGAAFLPRYEAFLRETGSASCEEAVRRTLGWEIGRKEFWAGAIAGGAGPVQALEEIVVSRGL
jgi:oligoendopeptidase F